MAATSAIMGCLLGSGDVAVMPSDGYYAARVLAQGFFAQIGVTIRTAPTAGDAQGAHLAGAKLLWLESPSNPGLDVCDIAGLVEKAHAQGVLVVVDNTTATVLGQRPLALGADFSLASDTKALTGHGDLILGHVAVRDPDWARVLRNWRTRFGAIPGPMEVWLAHRSLSTLDVRLERMAANALIVARFLSGRPEVCRVRYPGFSEDPAHAVAARQMTRFGPVVGFELAVGPGRREIPGCMPADRAGHQLRRLAYDGRAPRSLGRRRDLRGVHPIERGLRAPGRFDPGPGTSLTVTVTYP